LHPPTPAIKTGVVSDAMKDEDMTSSQVGGNQGGGNPAPGPDHFEIIVNGRPKRWNQPQISFTQVVALAYDPVPTGNNVTITVTYGRGASSNHEGSLVLGQSVPVKGGMVFNVVVTDKS
jgi:hypothetical protein